MPSFASLLSTPSESTDGAVRRQMGDLGRQEGLACRLAVLTGRPGPGD